TGHQMRVGAVAVERGTDIGADLTGAEDCDFHDETAPFGRGTPRRGPHCRILSTEYCLQYGSWGAKLRAAPGRPGAGTAHDRSSSVADRSSRRAYRSSHTVDALPSRTFPTPGRIPR